MNDAILIFTFSPVQPFIAEARRASDLFAGSQILVNLARAAAEQLERVGELIYPASLKQDVPNKIVACVPWAQVDDLAQQAEKALLKAWGKESLNAQWFLLDPKVKVRGDPIWHGIWRRQTENLWECYWAAAELADNSNPEEAYRNAYRLAGKALDATKRTRMFVACEEEGVKDTLSGKRSALRTQNISARTYWKRVAQSPKVTGSQLRADGRERLDAIGSVKRFGKTGQEKFASVSSVATDDFLAEASSQPFLGEYREVIKGLIGQDKLYKVDSRYPEDWPYDGDLFFKETLTEHRLEDNYNLKEVDTDLLQKARQALRWLYKEVGFAPSPYYAILVMDGDSMGQHISKCLEEEAPRLAHYSLSDDLGKFTGRVPKIVAEGQGRLIYAGGDDVLALFPLQTALQTAQKLAQAYQDVFQGWQQTDDDGEPFPFTASAGLAIVHHLYPLDAALKAARQAERQAKNVEGKNALAVRVLKRSGGTNQMVSPWDAIGGTFQELIALFQDKQLSTTLPYRLFEACYGLPEPGEMFQAELKRQIERHKGAKGKGLDASAWAKRLNEWAEKIAEKRSPREEPTDVAHTTTENLTQWLILARFIAQRGGGE